MPDKHGRFLKGEHWRPRRPYWDRDWLKHEYTDLSRSANDIAEQFGVTENAILFWLSKLDIPRRSMSEIRSKKKWGAKGKANPMYGRIGEQSPNWKGGITPERQAFYRTTEWRKVSKAVRLRDQDTCQNCGIPAPRSHKGHIHHIVPFDESVDLRADLNNLIVLCAKCHNQTHEHRDSEGRFTNVDSG